MNQQRPHSDASDHDRRASARFETRHAAQIGQPASLDTLIAATIVDMSTDGLCVEAVCELESGTRVEVEYYPDPTAAVEVIRGHIVHCKALRSGRNRIGIQRGYEVGTTPSVAREAPTTAPASIADAVAASGASSLPAQIRIVQPSGGGASKSRRAAMFAIAALVALVFLLAGIASTILSRDGEPGKASAAKSQPTSNFTELFSLEFGDVAVGVFEAEPEVVASPDLESISGPDYSAMSGPALLSHAQAALMANKGATSIEDFDALDAALDPGSVERFIARVARALQRSASGDREGAKILLRDALDSPGDVSAVWQEFGAHTLERIDSDAAFRAEPLALETLLEFSSRSSELDPSAPLSIDIDTSAYTLTVLRDGVPVRSFPIGLGRDGATPLGEFAVVDKIRDPDWYDRGRSVPAGDPENPLGSRWIGIGTDNKGTGVGIHPTAEDGSLRQPQSRGCIRMQTADAEELFRMIPIGTPVEIHR